jgi:hypothetical protein
LKEKDFLEQQEVEGPLAARTDEKKWSELELKVILLGWFFRNLTRKRELMRSFRFLAAAKPDVNIAIADECEQVLIHPLEKGM